MPGVRSLRGRTLLSLALIFAGSTAAFAQSSLRLAWNANTDSNIAGYRVTYVPQSGGSARTIDVGNVTSTTITGLNLGIWYNFSVVAYNTLGGVSAPSPAVSAFTTALSNLSTTASSTVAPGTGVSWTAVPPAGSPTLEYEYWMLS